MQVPFLDLQQQYRELKAEIDQGIHKVLDSSAYVGGASVSEFEADFAQFTGAAHVIGVANGTDALYLALRALEVGPGDEVITAANTFIATTEVITAVGATIVLVDCDPDSYTLDPTKLEAAITPQTKVIMPVHLYGQPADMNAIMEIANRHNIAVVEDACQAHGAVYGGKQAGTIGTIGCFSCYPGKNLGAYGDAGIITTNDATLNAKMRLLHNHGSVKKYVHEVPGWNSRLDSIQAEVLKVKLKHLAAGNAARNEHAAEYAQRLQGLPIKIPAIVNESHVWHLFVIETDQREDLAAFLNSAQVSTGIHYPTPVHLTEAYEDLSYGKGSFPVSEASAPRLLSLPMFPELTSEQIEYVCAQISKFFESEAAS